MAEVKLYDIRKRDYPNKRGDSFRSLQVFKCWVCGALTNQVIMGGYLGYGVRAICPQSDQCWHHELEEKIRWLNNPHPNPVSIAGTSKTKERPHRSFKFHLTFTL